MQLKPTKRLYTIEIEFPNGLTRNVQVKAVERETAERKALKMHPSAKGVKRSA